MPRSSVQAASSNDAATSRSVAAQTGASVSLPMLMTRNVLPQIAPHAAKAAQGHASKAARDKLGGSTSDIARLLVGGEGIEVSQERVERRGAHRHAVGDRDHPATVAGFTTIETVPDDRRMLAITQERGHGRGPAFQPLEGLFAQVDLHDGRELTVRLRLGTTALTPGPMLRRAARTARMAYDV